MYSPRFLYQTISISFIKKSVYPTSNKALRAFKNTGFLPKGIVNAKINMGRLYKLTKEESTKG